jgi:8-oxo-dGTP pyrophosphatase MutT (NUDIX family)
MPAPMPNLELIRSCLGSYEPTLANTADGVALAAVAIVAYEPAGGRPELLFIERAVREGDPWSGQMAFPGGRWSASDAHLAETAARETLEEVGVKLAAPLGRLDDFEGSRAATPRSIVVAPYVFAVPERPPLVLSHEVASTVWVPLDWILSPDSAVLYAFRREAYGGTFPAVRYDRYTIWGMTYRILASFVGVLGFALPDPQS